MAIVTGLPFGRHMQAGTNTSRCSSVPEYADHLHAPGIEAQTFDLRISELAEAAPEVIHLANSTEAALNGTDAMVVIVP